MTAFSEDPVLASQLAVQEINGIQSTGLMSQVKHISFYSGQTQTTPSIVDEQAAREIYLVPAEAAAKDAGVSSMMCSYATFQIKGFESQPDYACSNSGLLNRIVKGDWKFPGWITTDYGASKDASATSSPAPTRSSAATFFAPSIVVPLIDPASSTYSAAYRARVDDAVARIVYQYERFGLLDNSKIPAAYWSSVPQHGNVTAHDNSTHLDVAAGSAVALKLAERAATLLKNNGNVLPLSPSTDVAVSGQTASLLPASPGGERSWGVGDRDMITPLQVMQTLGGSHVASVPGIDLLGTTVPASALSTDAAGTTPGITRTTTTPAGVSTTSVDSVVDGHQTNLVAGNTYTWTGYINVTRADSYRLLFQRPFGTDLGNPAKYNQNIRNLTNSTLTLQVDGATKSLSDPDSKILANAYPNFASGVSGITTRAKNGQYLGYQNVTSKLDLTVGRHLITYTYKPTTQAATTPTLRFAWAATGADLQAAVSAAATKPVSVVYVDDTGSLTGDGVSAQTDVARLSVEQTALITQVAAAAHAAGNKVVVVLNTGNAVQMPWVDDVDAILEMWYPGQEGGTATAETLYGQSNPSGKLTLTFPKSSAQTLFAGHPERGSGTQDAGESTPTIKWTEGLNIGYRWYASAENTNHYTPLFAFGHGLSYTSFAYSGLSTKMAGNGGVDVTFTVKNTGSRAGGESPQVYVGPSPSIPASLAQTPIKLAQFDHIDLQAGESKTVTLNVTPRVLSSWSPALQDWVLGTGKRTFWVGTASDDLPLTTVMDIPVTTTATGSVGGSVNATLGLTLGTAPSFGAFTAGVARDYTATTTADVISTAGNATLSISDPSSSAPGHLVNGAFSLPSALQASATSTAGTGGAFADVSGSPTTLLTYSGPVSHDVANVAFKQHIGATDALRTGSYAKTLTYTLATTAP